MRFGADEAGKGPVLGSMFAAAVRAPDGALPDGVDDSKRLAPARREELDGEIRRAGTVAVAEIPVERIDDPETDMNSLTVAAQAEAVGSVAEPGDSGLCDAGDTSEDRFARRVGERVAARVEGVEVRAEHRADENDARVAAASVVAKVARDAHVSELAREYGDVGSGYPSDPNTRDFLCGYVAEHGEVPDCARRSWATCEDLLTKAEQSALSEF
jgi:ribonuclease HII